MKKALAFGAALLILFSLSACSGIARSAAEAASRDLSQTRSAASFASAEVSGERSDDSARSGFSSAGGGADPSGFVSDDSGAVSRTFGLDAFRRAYEQAGFSAERGDDPDTLRIWRGNDAGYYEIRFCTSAEEAAAKAKDYEKRGLKTMTRGSVVIAYPEDFSDHEAYIAPFESMW